MAQITARKIILGLKCSKEIKDALLQFYQEHKNDPTKQRRAFKQLLEQAEWHWLWLEQYPDTFELTSLYPKNRQKAEAELLSDTLLRADSVASTVTRWEKRGSTAVVMAVGDNNDFPECEYAAKQPITQSDAESLALLPLHRPGCRCSIMLPVTESQLQRAMR